MFIILSKQISDGWIKPLNIKNYKLFALNNNEKSKPTALDARLLIIKICVLQMVLESVPKCILIRIFTIITLSFG